MIEKVLDPDFADRGSLGNDLMGEFKRGFPLENLRPLLTSTHWQAQATAAFIMTFLGFELHFLLPEIVKLLDSRHAGTRFDTVEVLRGCTTPRDGKVLGRVLMHLDDEHPGVRWKVVQFICTADPWQLRVGLRNAAARRPESPFAIVNQVYERRWVITAEDIEWLIRHPDKVVRRFGVALAARPLYVVDDRLLDVAASSDDAEVMGLVKDAREGYLAPVYSISSSALVERSRRRAEGGT